MANRKIFMSTYQTIISYLKISMSHRQIEQMNIAGRRKIATVHTVAKEQGWLEESAVIPSESELKLFFEKQKKASTVTALTPHKEMGLYRICCAIEMRVNNGYNRFIKHIFHKKTPENGQYFTSTRYRFT